MARSKRLIKQFFRSSAKFVPWCLQNGYIEAVARDIQNRKTRRRRKLDRVVSACREFPDNHVNNRRDYYRKEYLKSEHWRNLRKEKLAVNPACERCGYNKRLDVHHKDYKNLYDVTTGDLETLCRKCHDAEHESRP